MSIDLDGDLVTGSVVLMGEIAWFYSLDVSLVLPATEVYADYDLLYFVDGTLSLPSPFVIIAQTQPLILWFAEITLVGTLYTGAATADFDFSFAIPGPVDLSGDLTTPFLLINQLLPVRVNGPAYQLAGTFVLGALTIDGAVTVVDPTPLSLDGALTTPSLTMYGSIQVYTALFELYGQVTLPAVSTLAEILVVSPDVSLTIDLTIPSVRMKGLEVVRHYVYSDLANRRIAVDQPWS